jgi:hypothetical protein
MSQANNEIDKNFVKMVKSARAYSRDRGKNMGYLDTIVSEFLGKLKEMKLEPLVEKEIKSIIGNILKFTTGPSQSEILPGEVDWLLLRIRMSQPPKHTAHSPKEILRDITTHQTFRGLNALSPDFMTILVESISKLPSDIFVWTRENVRFISSGEDSLAFSLRIEDPIKIKGFIFLCESLKYVKKEVQTKSIAHEIAHIKLGHTEPPFRKLSVEEVKKQEEEADKLAEEWLACVAQKQ